MLRSIDTETLSERHRERSVDLNGKCLPITSFRDTEQNGYCPNFSCGEMSAALFGVKLGHYSKMR